VPDLVTGRGVDGCGAVVGGEVVLGREAVDGLYLGEDSACDHRADAVEVGEAGAIVGNETADLASHGFDLRV
jgi:hypothetical protein